MHNLHLPSLSNTKEFKDNSNTSDIDNPKFASNSSAKATSLAGLNFLITTSPLLFLSSYSKVAIGKLKELSVFGDDYNTPDGTGVRDYIHVVDLAKGHIKALDKLNTNCGLVTYNLGTGNGYSVLDMIKAFSKASGKEIPYKIVDRRPGDVAMCYADTTKANNELGWKAEFGIDRICEDSWRWQSNNPNGYE